MDVAALILATLALVVSCSTLVVFLAKNVFSKHQVQLVPAFGDNLESVVGQKPADPFAEIGDPLSDDEERYFADQDAKKRHGPLSAAL